MRPHMHEVQMRVAQAHTSTAGYCYATAQYQPKAAAVDAEEGEDEDVYFSDDEQEAAYQASVGGRASVNGGGEEEDVSCSDDEQEAAYQSSVG